MPVERAHRSGFKLESYRSEKRMVREKYDDS